MIKKLTMTAMGFLFVSATGFADNADKNGEDENFSKCNPKSVGIVNSRHNAPKASTATATHTDAPATKDPKATSAGQK